MMGRLLARRHPVEADYVMPVPDSGVHAALGYAEESGIPFEFGLIRNHYVGRTFIEPKQHIRSFGVKVKLNPVRELLKGKRVVLVDDSIVRGTTSRKIVQMVRSAGAAEIHLRISSPPTTHSCFYGIDTPTREQLIASHNSTRGDLPLHRGGHPGLPDPGRPAGLHAGRRRSWLLLRLLHRRLPGRPPGRQDHLRLMEGPTGALQERFEDGLRFLATALALKGDRRSLPAAISAACDSVRCFLKIFETAAERHLPDPGGELPRLRDQCVALLALGQTEAEALDHALEAARLARDEAARLLPRLMAARGETGA